jgi:hypothetical protein
MVLSSSSYKNAYQEIKFLRRKNHSGVIITVRNRTNDVVRVYGPCGISALKVSESPSSI